VQLVRISEVVRIALDAADEEIQVTVKKPVLIIKLKGLKDKTEVVRITYLAKGISWAPAYTINLVDEKTGTIEQQAVIKNELADFKNAKVNLISGFPSMRFGHVISPMSTGTALSSFFAQLAQRPGSSGGIMGQQAVMRNVAQTSEPLSDTEVTGSEGLDLHYQDVGPRTMDEGDSLYLKVAKKEMEYERIVEWTIPESRNSRGHGVNRPPLQDSIWDAVRFRNPFGFPMTTAPVATYTKGAFSGQQISYWVDPGERTTVPITRALSIRATQSEHEVQGERRVVHFWGDTYRESEVEGIVAVNNHRRTEITLVIKLRFWGELISAEREPVHTLLEEGAWYANVRNELVWTLKLKPGEKLVIKYRHKILVDI
jgi:hypothetical protein